MGRTLYCFLESTWNVMNVIVVKNAFRENTTTEKKNFNKILSMDYNYDYDIIIIIDSITITLKDNHLVFELKQKHFDKCFR